MSSNIVVAVLALTLVVIAVLLAIVVERQRRRERIVPVSPPLRVRKRSHTAIAASNIPPNLGVHPVEPFERLAKRVERALDADYHQKLKHRVMTRYPHFSEDGFEGVLFELKRYFVLNLILPRVPMFSEACDDVWHEMLMFTRDYQRFCEQIAGTCIHHTPYGERKPMPDEKAWFDWVYTHLYALTPCSTKLWKGFFHHPLPKEQIAFFFCACERSGDSAALV